MGRKHTDRVFKKTRETATWGDRPAERRMRRGEMQSTQPSSVWPKSISVPPFLPSAALLSCSEGAGWIIGVRRWRMDGGRMVEGRPGGTDGERGGEREDERGLLGH